jgi:hypothetical protein
MTRAALEQGDKRGGVDAPWNKIKFDRQIVAVAKVAGVTAIYSDDRQLRAFAEQQGLRVMGLADLPLPREPELPLPPPSEPPDAGDERLDDFGLLQLLTAVLPVRFQRAGLAPAVQRSPAIDCAALPHL